MGTTSVVSSRNGPEALRPDMSRAGLPPDILRRLAASLKSQWKRYRKRLKRCQKKFSVDAVHDSRVETRRLLSLVELLGPFLSRRRAKKVVRALKRHLDNFDDLRDTQVQAVAVGELLRSFPAASPFHTYLLKREARFIRETRKHIKRVKTRRLRSLIAACCDDVERQHRKLDPEQAAAQLLASITRAFARARQLRARVDPIDTRTIHYTRVAFKKFRYMVEAMADYLPGVSRRLLPAMHRYQTMMGDIQDGEVLSRTLDKFLRKHAVAPETAPALRLVLVRRRGWLLRRYLAAADQLRTFWPLARPPKPLSASISTMRSMLR